MSNEIAIPFAGQARSAAFQALSTPELANESLADGIGSSYGVIGYKGKVWSLRYRGETHVFTRPDDGSPSSFIDVIILNQAGHKSKSFYEGGFDQNASAGKRPTCSSLDSIVPDADAQVKQATACAICPRNEWKQNAQGRKSRDCTDYKRLAVMLLPSVSNKLLGAPLMEPLFLRVPPASLNDLALAGESLKSQGYFYFEVVMRISFDPQEAHPKMVFRPIQLLTDKEAPVVIPLRTDAMTLRIVEGDRAGPLLLSQSHPVTPVQQQATTPAPTNVVPLVQQAAAQPVAQTPIDTGFGSVQASPTPAQPAQTISPSNGAANGVGGGRLTPDVVQQPRQEQAQTVDTGFDLDLKATVVPERAIAPAQQTAADTGGDAVDSDADLDAKIRALLPQ